jgi:large subunit ribosomal protein L4
VFGAGVKPHLVHEAVRAELNAQRAGTRGAKSRARAGSTRVAHWTGGGVAFPPTMRSFAVKVNRKALRAALRGALADHAQAGTLGVVDGSGWDAPSTKNAAAMLGAWGKELPLVVVTGEDEQNLAKSFRNLDRVVVVTPGELEVAAVVWASSLLVSQAALEGVEARAGNGPVKTATAKEGAE